MSPATPKSLVKREEYAEQKQTFSHPLNPNSEITGVRLSQLTGLERTGVSLATVAPGKESYVYHSHECEEEWIYILSGSGIAEIDDQEYAVSPGDFMGFATPSVAHHLRNNGSEDLVYLMGGESRDFEVADFPRQGKRMLRRGTFPDMKIEIYDLDAGRPLGFADFTDD